VYDLFYSCMHQNKLMACVLVQAFDDCTTISITFKLLDSFEGLLDREVIAADLEKKHADLLGSYASDLKVGVCVCVVCACVCK